MDKKLQERLEALMRQREAAIGAMQAVFDKAAAEERTFDDAEQSAFDEEKTKIGSLDLQIDNIKVLAQASLSRAVTLPGSDAAGTGAGAGAVDVVRGQGSVELGANPRMTVHRTLPKGTAFTRYVMAMAAAKGNVMGAAEVAKQRWGSSTPEVETILRAAVAAGTTTDTTWAKPLVPYQDMQSELIELLRPMTIIGRMTGFRNTPFNVRMPRQTSGATVGWVGEAAPKPVTKLGFDTITIPHAKIAAIIAITDELARMSTPSAEATVRQDLLETVAQFMDVQFIDPDVAAVADVSPGSVSDGITGVNATGGSVAQVTTDLNLALTSLAVANIAMRAPYWVMHTRQYNYLLTLRTAQDIFAFRDELVAGRLMGFPVIVSNNVPLRDQNAGGGTEGYITLLDASEVFMADDGETMIDVSREASLQMDTAPSAGAQALVSLWQNNLVGVRAERYVYWQRRRNAAVYLIDMVTY
jgi:HK97 family phage major capsid protein